MSGPRDQDLNEGPAAAEDGEGLGTATSPRRPASGARPPMRAVRPWRAAAVVLIGLAVGIAVLARGGAGSIPTAVTHQVRTTAAGAPRTTHHVVRTTVPTTVPTTTTTTLAPASVKVLVLNGWTTAHGALYFQTQLRNKGYDTLAPNDATSSDIKTSEVLYTAPHYKANALAIASEMAIPPSAVMVEASTNDSVVPPTLLPQASVVVVIGQDISNQVPAGYTGG